MLSKTRTNSAALPKKEHVFDGERQIQKANLFKFGSTYDTFAMSLI
jgi:hypothetical protein